eukprot:scaffold322133_cov46-Prasinocladus_malaysianus.AAC.1
MRSGVSWEAIIPSARCSARYVSLAPGAQQSSRAWHGSSADCMKEARAATATPEARSCPSMRPDR